MRQEKPLVCDSLFCPAGQTTFWAWLIDQAPQKPRDNTIGIDNGMYNRYTTGMKMAISIPDELFEELDKVSKQYQASRSHMITLAIGEYLDRMKSRKLLEDLNASFVSDSPAEGKIREKGKRHYGGKVLKERY